MICLDAERLFKYFIGCREDWLEIAASYRANINNDENGKSLEEYIAEGFEKKAEDMLFVLEAITSGDFIIETSDNIIERYEL
jgi:hypothetical protein